MPDYVQGDDFVEQRKFDMIEEGKLHRRMEWTVGALFAIAMIIYAVFGGRGWLALSIFLGICLIALVVDGARIASHWFHSSNENRLRIIEDRLQRISDEQYVLARRVDPDRYPLA